MSVVEPIRAHFPRRRDDDPFQFEQGSFHREATLKSAQLSVGPDRPVAGNEDGERVARQGPAHRSRAAWNSQPPRDPPIGADPPPGDLVFGPEDASLKLGTPLERDEAQVKADGVSLKETSDSRGEPGNRRTRSLVGTREGHLDDLLHRRPLTGEEHAIYPWPCFRPAPDDAQRAESRRHEHVREVSECHTLHVAFRCLLNQCGSLPCSSMQHHS
jgi:hypothetical protein